MATIWIDPDECMGAGTCAQIAPQIFVDRGDGIWAVKESATHFDREVIFDGQVGEGHGPDGYEGRARIPESLLDLAIEAAEECPGECIHVDV